MCLLKHPTWFIYLFCAIVSHCNPAGNLKPPYGADIALLSYPHMVILLLYMAAGGGGRGGVHPTLNAKMYVMCAILFLPPPWDITFPRKRERSVEEVVVVVEGAPLSSKSEKGKALLSCKKVQQQAPSKMAQPTR